VKLEIRSVQGAVRIEALDYRIPPVVTATGIIPNTIGTVAMASIDDSTFLLSRLICRGAHFLN
jgi:hypothetical protein